MNQLFFQWHTQFEHSDTLESHLFWLYRSGLTTLVLMASAIFNLVWRNSSDAIADDTYLRPQRYTCWAVALATN